MGKKYDLKVKFGTYSKDGETKNSYRTIGCLMQKDDGGEYLLLDPTVNLSAFDRGVDNQGQPRTSLIVSMFEPRETDNKPRPAATKTPTGTPEFEE